VSTFEPIPLTSNQVREAGEVLARAFFSDPFFVYALPDPERRRRVLGAWCTDFVRYGYYFGEVYTTAGRVRGVAVWLPPGRSRITPLRALRAGWLWTPFRLGIGTLWRLSRAGVELSWLYRRVDVSRQWHLSWLGVDPAYQRQGIGSALLQPVLARADAEGIACCLATFTEENVRFYQRRGFRIVAEGAIARNGPRVWIMQRDPVLDTHRSTPSP
jgi:GNAT superfamily N-acetyltransferase